MSDLLIYNKIHWMDKLSDEEVAERIKQNPNFELKYNSRYQKGDVVEVRPDGFWATHGFNKDTFCVVCRRGVPRGSLDYLSEHLLEDFIHPDVTQRILKRRKWNINIDYINFGVKQREEITEVELVDRMTEKTIEARQING